MKKKISLVLILLVLAVVGVWFVSGRQKQSFSNGVVTPAASVMTEDLAGKEDMILVPDVAVSNDAEKSKTDTGAEADEQKGEQAVKGEKKVETEEKGNAEKTNVSVIDRLVSFGYENRSSRDIDTVIVHSSYDALGKDPYSVSGVIAEYKQAGVSPHYLIDRKGIIYRLVEDRDVAYHAGVSKTPDGRSGVNAFSIGIEVIGKDTDSPTSAQYASLRSLIASLKSKYSIKYVLGHSDIAPGRKTDPWGFDWKELKQ
jgi:hypothetical protein